MKSIFTSSAITMSAYLLWIGVATQLFFYAPCLGAPTMTTSTAKVESAKNPPHADVFRVKIVDKNEDPDTQVIREIEKVMSQMREQAVMVDQIDRQGTRTLNCTIKIDPAPSPSLLPPSNGEYPDLLDQVRNLLINISVWMIASTFFMIRETFNWIMSLAFGWKLLILFVIGIVAGLIADPPAPPAPAPRKPKPSQGAKKEAKPAAVV